MYDSFLTKCPNCGKQLEFQSKTGSCMLITFTEKDLPAIVAAGIDEDVVECQYCETNWRLECDLPSVVRTYLVKTRQKESYPGNFNPNIKKNIQKLEELKKRLNR